jgi:hypothetical protein
MLNYLAIILKILGFRGVGIDFLLGGGLFKECFDLQEVFVTGAKGIIGDIGPFEVIEDLLDVTLEIGYFGGRVQVEGGGLGCDGKEFFEGFYFFGCCYHRVKIDVRRQVVGKIVE